LFFFYKPVQTSEQYRFYSLSHHHKSVSLNINVFNPSPTNQTSKKALTYQIPIFLLLLLLLITRRDNYSYQHIHTIPTNYLTSNITPLSILNMSPRSTYTISMPSNMPPCSDLASYSRTMHMHTKRQMEAANMSSSRRGSGRSQQSSGSDMVNGISPSSSMSMSSRSMNGTHEYHS
jgi:hypothetical protein